MALIHQISNLRLLKYATSPYGKYSGTTPNPLTQEYIPFVFEGIGPNTIDFIYRGGDKTDWFVKKDEERFGRFLNTPNGDLFLFKQHTLSRQDVPAAYGTIKSEPIREYSENLTKKAISEGIGKQVFYDGKGDNDDIPFDSKYAYIYKNVKTEDNVLVKLYNNKQIVSIGGDNEIISYQSGPGSNFGQGKTIISFIDQRTGINNPLSVSYPIYFKKGGIKLHESDTEINYAGSLGISKIEDLVKESGFNADGSQNKLFGPKDTNKTPSKDEKTENLLSRFPSSKGKPMYKVTPPNLTSSLGVTNLITDKVDSSFPYDSNLGTGISDQGTSTTNFGFNTSQENTRPVLIDLGKNYLAYRSHSPTDFRTYIGEIKITGGETLPLTTLYTKLGINLSTPRLNNNYSVYKSNSLKSNERILFYEGKSTVFNSTSTLSKIPFKGGGISGLKDFREEIIKQNPSIENASTNTVIAKSVSYSMKNRDVRTHLGDPGRRTNRNVFDWSKITQPLDKINALPVKNNYRQVEEDMIQLVFYALNTDQPEMQHSKMIQFRAFLDSFEDSYTSNWNDIEYAGRGDTFYSYKGTTRSISLGFTMAAQSFAELKPMYTKLNYFISTIMPDYSNGGIKRGSLIRLTVGGYLVKQLGFLRGIKIGVPENAPWEIGLQPNGAVMRSQQLPQVLKITGLDFQPIEEFLPQKWKTTNGTDASDGRWIAKDYD